MTNEIKTKIKFVTPDGVEFDTVEDAQYHQQVKAFKDFFQEFYDKIDIEGIDYDKLIRYLKNVPATRQRFREVVAPFLNLENIDRTRKTVAYKQD